MDRRWWLGLGPSIAHQDYQGPVWKALHTRPASRFDEACPGPAPQVNWHRSFDKASGYMFHQQLRTPMVEKEPIPAHVGDFWPATHAVPWLCWAMDLPGHPRQLAIVARHWGILRPLGLPSVSGTSYRLPGMLLTQNPALQLPAEAAVTAVAGTTAAAGAGQARGAMEAGDGGAGVGEEAEAEGEEEDREVEEEEEEEEEEA